VRITPLDVRNHPFRRKLSGYDREEVDAFLRMVAEDYEGVLREAEGLREQVVKLETRVADLAANETVLQETLTTAQKLSEDLKRTAVKEAEVVIGSRYVAGGSAAQMPSRRALLSHILNGIYRRVLAVPVLDMSSGFRGYQRKVLDELELESEKFDVLEEILVKIYSLGWQVVEVPFGYGPRVAGTSHADVMSFTPHFLRTLFRLWAMRTRYRSADYDSRAYDSLVLPQRWWQRRRFEVVSEMAGADPQRLDIGCGSSRIIQSRPESVGLDFEISKLRFLRRTNSRLVRATCSSLPFADHSFGTVVNSQLIEHVPYDRNIFLEMNRVLRPGGTLVIGTPDYGRVAWRFTEWVYKWLLPYAYADDHITHYTRFRLTEELASAGFAIQRYAYVFGGELVMQCVKREECRDPGS